MFGPEVAKSRTAELQEAANDALQVVKELAHDAGVRGAQAARRLGAKAWAFVHGAAILTRDDQLPARPPSSSKQLG